jgi:hypothetical protein
MGGFTNVDAHCSSNKNIPMADGDDGAFGVLVNLELLFEFLY